MRRRANPTLIGAFVVAGLALLVLAIVGLAGNELFSPKARAVMYFSGSVYGLQVGAPVVFRGVRVGSVASVQVVYDRGGNGFSIPVVAELDADAVSGLDGKTARADIAEALPTLVQRGLSAQLAMQSLLTGLLYIDLDLRPQAERSRRGTPDTPAGTLEIPTTATPIQALREQLDQLDVGRLAEDLSAIAASARAVVSAPELKQALGDVAAITANVRRLSQQVDRRAAPLADELQRALADVRGAVQQIDRTAQGLDSTVGRIGTASDRAAALLAPDSPLLRDLQRTADEVARSAAALRGATDRDSALVQGSAQALEDLSKAARALRDLAETLEQQPEALLRGREVAR